MSDMHCLRCGHDNGPTPHLQSVMRKSAIGSPGDTVAKPEPIYSRWACDKVRALSLHGWNALQQSLRETERELGGQNEAL